MFPVTRPQGWKWHSPSCFWLGEDRVSYSDARKMCSDYSSMLVTVTNRSVPCQCEPCKVGSDFQGLENHGQLSVLACCMAHSHCPSRFVQAYVSSLIYGWDGEYFWTALQDINETGAFRWLSGDEVMYTHWNRNQPGKGWGWGWDGDSPFSQGGAGTASQHSPTLRLASPLLL